MTELSTIFIFAQLIEYPEIILLDKFGILAYFIRLLFKFRGRYE